MKKILLIWEEKNKNFSLLIEKKLEGIKNPMSLIFLHSIAIFVAIIYSFCFLGQAMGAKILGKEN